MTSIHPYKVSIIALVSPQSTSATPTRGRGETRVVLIVSEADLDNSDPSFFVSNAG